MREWPKGQLADAHDTRWMMDLNLLRTLLANWRAERRWTGVQFRETTTPSAPTFQDDYNVIYEAVFEPTAIHQARIELWLASSGHIAVGIETKERIAYRLGVKKAVKGFAAGHEPQAISEIGLRALLNAVADGHLSIRVKPSLLTLDSTRAVITRSDMSGLVAEGRMKYPWIEIRESSARPLFGHLLGTQRWA